MKLENCVCSCVYVYNGACYYESKLTCEVTS